MFCLSDGEEIMTLAFFVLIHYRSVTVGQTDGQTDIPPLAIPAVCIARYANALVKTNLVMTNLILFSQSLGSTGLGPLDPSGYARLYLYSGLAVCQ